MDDNIKNLFRKYRIKKAESFLLGSAVCLLFVLCYFVYSDIYIREHSHFVYYRLPLICVVLFKLLLSVKKIRQHFWHQLIIVYEIEAIAALFMIYGITINVLGSPLFKVALLAASIIHLCMFLYNIPHIKTTLLIIWGSFFLFFFFIYKKAVLFNLTDLLVDLPNLITMMIAVSILAFFRFRDMKNEFISKYQLELEKDNSDRISNALLIKNNELLVTKEEIESQNEEIINQRNYIEEQRDQLEYRNQQYIASLNNASRVQLTIQNNQSLSLERLGFFYFNQPKDVVSGDFLWVDRVDNLQFIIVADCTGHGVPGALLSMLGTSLLNQIIKENKITDPAAILKALNNAFLKLYKNPSSLNDGMDLSIVTFSLDSTDKTKILYSGAKSPLVIIDQNNEMQVIKGDRFSIGENSKPNFKTQVVEINQNSFLFQFSDGYKDQIGGPRNRKLMPKGFYEKLQKTTQKEEPITKYKTLEKEFLDWKNYDGLRDQIDDILVVGYQI